MATLHIATSSAIPLAPLAPLVPQAPLRLQATPMAPPTVLRASGACARAARVGSSPDGRAARRGARGALAYQCSKCPKRFTSQSNLRRHFVNLHGQDRGPFYCPFCCKVTKNKISLKSHIYTYHKLHSPGPTGPAPAPQWSDPSGSLGGA